MTDWVTDGHEIAVRLGAGWTEVVVSCPHDAGIWAGVPWGQRPPCRQATDEEGRPDLIFEGGACMFAEYVDDRRAVGSDGEEITFPPTRVDCAWLDEDTLAIRPHEPAAGS